MSLFVLMARATERRMGGFSVQGLANIAWALVTAGQKDALLFAALARAAEQCAGDFKPQEGV